MWIKNTVNGTWAVYRRETGVPYINEVSGKEGDRIVGHFRVWCKKHDYGTGNTLF